MPIKRTFSLAIETFPGRNLFERVSWGLRNEILRGRLRPGDKLPSTRELQDLLRVSRSTLVEVFEQLIAEGYITTQVGRGTFVSERLPEELLDASPVISASRPTTVSQLEWNTPPEWPGSELFVGKSVPFRPGLGALHLFPTTLWARLAARRCRLMNQNSLGYGDPAGLLPLREAIAEHISYMRGARICPEQVMITSSSQQALQLAFSLVLRNNDTVLIEEPGYPGARAAILQRGGRLKPLPVDDEGATVPRRNTTARMLFLTPSFQYPLGIQMTLRRRLEILAWAKQERCWIVEDDYDCEFRYQGRPVPSLHALDEGQHVLYALTFSKSLAPALRMGCLVVPEPLIDCATKHLHVLGPGVPVLEQLVFTDFIQEGHFRRLMRTMRELLEERQSHLRTALERIDQLECISSRENGLHITTVLTQDKSDVELSRAAALQGVHLVPLSRLYQKPNRARNGFLLGFGAFRTQQLDQAVQILARLLRN